MKNQFIERLNSILQKRNLSQADLSKMTGIRSSSISDWLNGKYDVPGVMSISSYTPPKYCHHCGHPFPWTESTLNSISELLDMQDQLTEDEKQHFMSYLPIIFTETPQSEVTALKLRLLFNKLPSEIGSLAKNVITDVISESIKKILFP